MKILVLSDSHGNLTNMLQTVEITHPDMIFHLGDGWRDAFSLQEHFPSIPFELVAGNCDLGCDIAREKLLSIQNHRLLLCHGHTLGVKSGLLRARYAAQEHHADILLFGHTHEPFIDYLENTWLFNPGSIGNNSHPSYGVLLFENGQVSPALYTL